MNKTKALILDTGYKLFKEKGYDAVTVNDICEACHITKPTFYYHLNSKEEILYNFYGPVTEGITTNMLHILSAKDPWEQLILCFQTLINKSEELGVDLSSQLLIANLKEDHGSYDFKKCLTDIAYLLIDRCKEEGIIKNDHSTEELYSTFAYAFLGYEVSWCIKNGNIDRKQLVRQAMETIFNVNTNTRRSPN